MTLYWIGDAILILVVLPVVVYLLRPVLAAARAIVTHVHAIRDAAAAEDSDDRAVGFIRDELGDFDIERAEVIGGRVAVSRARADVLEPSHA